MWRLGARSITFRPRIAACSTPSWTPWCCPAGRVVYRRSVGYQDLLSADAVDEAVLGARIEQQHREILEGVRDGSLPLDEHQPAAVAA